MQDVSSTRFRCLPGEILSLILDCLEPGDIISLVEVHVYTAGLLAKRHYSRKDRDSNTIMHLVSSQERKEWMDIIIARCPDFSIEDKLGRGPLHVAAKDGREAIVRLLLDAGAGIDLQSTTGYDGGSTALAMAIGKNKESIMKLLIDRGAGISVRDRNDRQPLHWAAARGHLGAIQLLLNNGADISAVSQYGTPVYMAACWGHGDAMELLVENGADIFHAEPGNRMPLLHRAGEMRYVDVARILLSAGATTTPTIKGGLPNARDLVPTVLYSSCRRTGASQSCI